jgi:hypothetical protein
MTDCTGGKGLEETFGIIMKRGLAYWYWNWNWNWELGMVE